MASSSALKTIAQDEPMLDASNVGGDLTDLQTRNNLAHSDSNVSLDQQVVGRVDSVALAHRRMSRLGNTDDSITVAKRRQRRNEEGDQGGSGGSDSCGMSADGAGNATAESSGVLPDRLPTGGSSEGADSPTRTGGLRQKLTSFFKGRTQDGSKGSSLSPASTARASGGEVGGEVPGLGRHSQVRFSEEPPKEVPS